MMGTAWKPHLESDVSWESFSYGWSAWENTTQFMKQPDIVHRSLTTTSTGSGPLWGNLLLLLQSDHGQRNGCLYDKPKNIL